MEQSQASPGAAGASNNVRFGVYNQPGNHAGKTVKSVREGVAKLWGIPADANAFIGKEKVSDDHVLQPGQNLEFHRKAGEKG